MSLITQLGSTDPNFPWVISALPLAIGLDLALGDVPGRTYPEQALRWLIASVESGVDRVVTRLGGGRGGELFGGLLLTTLVVGTPASLAWLLVDLSDLVGGPLSLVSRTGLIVAGLVIRATGDRICHVAEAKSPVEAQRRFSAIGGGPARDLENLGIDRVCVALVGEKTLEAIVGPLCWLAIGGPAGFWGYLSIQTLRATSLRRQQHASLMSRVPMKLADLADLGPSLLTCIWLTVAALILRLDAGMARQAGWIALRKTPRSVVSWSQASLAGALGIQIRGGRVFPLDSSESSPMVGIAVHSPNPGMVILAVRLMQITTLLAAGSFILLSFLS